MTFMRLNPKRVDFTEFEYSRNRVPKNDLKEMYKVTRIYVLTYAHLHPSVGGLEISQFWVASLRVKEIGPSLVKETWPSSVKDS